MASSRITTAPGAASRHRLSSGLAVSWLWVPLVVVLGIAFGGLTATDQTIPVTACGITFAAIVCAWLAHRIGITLAVILPVLLAALLVPHSVELGAEAGLALMVFMLVLRGSHRNTSANAAAAASLVVVFYWLLLTLNPNVPSLSVGLLGVRKTSFMFVGLAVGLLWPKGSPEQAEKLIVRLLCLTGIAALSVHLFLPALEASFIRGASVYTEEFGGQARMSGFFSGPFHVSLLGAFLALWSWHAYLARVESRRILLVYFLSGCALLVFADVRSGYVAVAVGVGVTLLLRPGFDGKKAKIVKLTIAVLGIVALLLASGVISNRAISSIPHLGEETRVTSRFTYWQTAISMIRASPIVGWGAGSAGATLETAFAAGRHVTAHNQLLGFVVEGGLIGLVLIVAVLALFWKAVKAFGVIAHPAMAALIVLVVFGLSGDISEALPVSLFLMILIGLRGHSDTPQCS